MEAKRINQEEITVLDIEPAIINEERSLILLDNRPQKKIDETISTPHQYVSRCLLFVFSSGVRFQTVT